jgi:hypothetical protein
MMCEYACMERDLVNFCTMTPVEQNVIFVDAWLTFLWSDV